MIKPNRTYSDFLPLRKVKSWSMAVSCLGVPWTHNWKSKPGLWFGCRHKAPGQIPWVKRGMPHQTEQTSKVCQRKEGLYSFWSRWKQIDTVGDTQGRGKISFHIMICKEKWLKLETLWAMLQKFLKCEVAATLIFREHKFWHLKRTKKM